MRTVWTSRFDLTGRTPWVDGLLTGPMGVKRLRMIVDTGAWMTVIDAGIIDALGYSARMGHRLTKLVGADSAEPGYLLDVEWLETMGVKRHDFEVVCQTLPANLGVEGLVGMDFLSGHVLTIDNIEGRILLPS